MCKRLKFTDGCFLAVKNWLYFAALFWLLLEYTHTQTHSQLYRIPRVATPRGIITHLVSCTCIYQPNWFFPTEWASTPLRPFSTISTCQGFMYFEFQTGHLNRRQLPLNVIWGIWLVRILHCIRHIYLIFRAVCVCVCERWSGLCAHVCANVYSVSPNIQGRTFTEP